MGGKLLDGIKNMNDNSLACVRVKSENGDGEEGREWRLLPSLLYAYNLVLCGQSENNLKQWWGILLRCVEERI